jgi:outer membrane biosynthesis protein TonB
MAPAFLFLLVTLHGSFAEAADDNRPRYSLKQDQPDTGTNIRKDVANGSVIPLDKRYAELSPEEQSYVKSQYENLSPSDEPPFPVDGLRPIYKAIATAQQKLLVTGEMTLAVEVSAQGQATSVSVLRSADPEMTKLAATVLMLQKYKPALCNGNPCIMQFPFRIAFTTRH